MDCDALECRYDGPIPPADPALARLPPAGLRARLFAQLAESMRAQAARRRAALAFPEADRATRLLACYRAHGVLWAEHAKAGADRSTPPRMHERIQPTMW